MSIIIEKKARLVCILLGIILLLIYVPSIHLPAVIGGQIQPSMTNLRKDLALAGRAWFLAGSFLRKKQIQSSKAYSLKYKSPSEYYRWAFYYLV
jgi:hypothetical protein